MYEATQTYLSVTFQHDRLHLTDKRLQQQQRSQGPYQQSTPSTPPIFLQRIFSGIPSTYDLRVAQLNNRRNGFSPCFLCRKVIPCFLVHPPPMPYNNSQITSVLCVMEHRDVCSFSRTYVTCTSTNYMSICPNLYNTTLGVPGTQPLAMLLCGFFWRSNNRNHHLLVLVVRALASSISMYVRAPTEIQK